MKLSSFRVQLAIALGLPLVPAACTTKPPQNPDKPRDGGGSGSGSPTAVAAAGDTCAVDQVREFVCGLTDPKHDQPSANAKPPYEACAVNAIPLVQFDDYKFIDSSKWGNHDPGLATFAYDADRTESYRYGGTVNPGDTWCCYERCEPLAVSNAPRTALPAGKFEHEQCVPPPDAGASMPAKGASQCPAGMKLKIEDEEPLDDAPFKRVDDDGDCCYTVASRRKCPMDMFQDDSGQCRHPERGRPLRENGVAIVAPTTRRDGWRDATADGLGHLDPEARAYAAGAWSREGAAEHASVAAFARLSIDLMVVGAPSDLIDDAHVAARDEIRHARLAYGLASAFGDVAVGPGRLAVSPAARAVDLVSLAEECFVDGCVGETVAAMAAAEARARAIPAVVRDALDAITDDEARHAALAYRIVAWALREGGAPVRTVIESQLARVRAELAAHAPVLAGDPVGFDESLGVLATATAFAVRRRVLAEIVVPCTEGLLYRIAPMPSPQ
jgi:hypothetical protein